MHRDGLYGRDQFGITLVDNTFRATVIVPPNVSPGPVDVKGFLFQNGEVAATAEATLTLKTAGGIESAIYEIIAQYPWFNVVVALLLFAMTHGLLRIISAARRETTRT